MPIVNFTKTLKSRFIENETLFFLQMKKFINYISWATLWQKILLYRRYLLSSSEVNQEHFGSLDFFYHYWKSYFIWNYFFFIWTSLGLCLHIQGGLSLIYLYSSRGKERGFEGCFNICFLQVRKHLQIENSGTTSQM